MDRGWGEGGAEEGLVGGKRGREREEEGQEKGWIGKGEGWIGDGERETGGAEEGRRKGRNRGDWIWKVKRWVWKFGSDVKANNIRNNLLHVSS